MFSGTPHLPAQPLVETLANYYGTGPYLCVYQDRNIKHISRETGISRETIYRWLRTGRVSVRMAEQAINAMGKHPTEVWPDYPHNITIHHPAQEGITR